jgi:hypothetical protein
MSQMTKVRQEPFVRVDTVMNDLQISKPLAYKLMKEMNDELSAKGYITISGRVPRAYYYERFFGLGKVNE